LGPSQYTLAPFLGSIAIGILITQCLGGQPASQVSAFLGRASYHLFIAHWILAALLVWMLEVPIGSFRLCLPTLVVLLLLSVGLVRLELYIERWRRRIAPLQAG
jgi:peptidoglycan/LPS O-acetylase OafA/YrhL